jgi:hypothetical protein
MVVVLRVQIDPTQLYAARLKPVDWFKALGPLALTRSGSPVRLTSARGRWLRSF